jgi:hypothetical protein
MSARVPVNYASAAEFVAAFDDEISLGGVFLDGIDPAGLTSGAACIAVIAVSGDRIEIPARVGAVSAAGVALLFADLPAEVTALAEKLRAAAAEPPPDPNTPIESSAPEVPASPNDSSRGTVAGKVAGLTATQKMQLALSGTREERMALLRDTNRVLHGFVLKNPRIGLDEVQAAAKLTSLAPEALQQIADHAEWSRSPIVCTALVRNPKTPMATAVRLLDRIPEAEVRIIAKGSGRAQLVQAARRKLNL